MFVLPLERIRPDEDQVRKENKLTDDPEVQELAESIRDVGLLEPLNLRYIAEGDFYRIVAGERRFVASKLAGLTEVPVKLLEVDDRTARQIQLQENIHRADLTAMELSTALNELAQDGLSQDDLARMIHKSKAYVSKALGVARKLSPEVQESAAGMTMDHLHEISQVPEEKQPDVVQYVQETGATRDQLREHVAELKPRGGAGRPATVKAFRKVYTTSGGISVTFASQRASEGNVALLAALGEVKKQLAKEKSDEA